MSGDYSLVEEFLRAEFSALRKITETPHNIRQDRYDSTIYEELRNVSEKVKELEGRGSETFSALLQDLWATFYKADPTLQEKEKVSNAHRINRPFVERMLEDSVTKEARLTTMLDELSSAVAATEAGERLVEEINQREDLRKALEDAAGAQRAEMEGDHETAGQLMARAEQTLQGAARDVRRAVRQSVKAGQEKAEEVQTTLASWGLEPKDLQSVPIGDRMRLAQTITGRSNLKRVADLVGKMRNLARARQRQKVKRRRDEIHSITIGADLNHVLPAELAALRQPLRRLDFYRRFTEGQVLQYELEHQERQGRGPIVACIDISGSMNGGPLEWAVSCALAFADTAARQKRHCHILFFDTEVKKEFSFTPGEKDAEKFVQMATVGAGGGTDYQPALERAMEMIEKQKDFQWADIVMLTDGVCSLPEDFKTTFQDFKKNRQVSSYTVLIGGYDYRLGELKQWNDKTWSITNLVKTGDEIAGELFEEVY